METSLEKRYFFPFPAMFSHLYLHLLLNNPQGPGASAGGHAALSVQWSRWNAAAGLSLLCCPKHWSPLLKLENQSPLECGMARMCLRQKVINVSNLSSVSSGMTHRGKVLSLGCLQAPYGEQFCATVCKDLASDTIFTKNTLNFVWFPLVGVQWKWGAGVCV